MFLSDLVAKVLGYGIAAIVAAFFIRMVLDILFDGDGDWPWSRRDD